MSPSTPAKKAAVKKAAAVTKTTVPDVPRRERVDQAHLDDAQLGRPGPPAPPEEPPSMEAPPVGGPAVDGDMLAELAEDLEAEDE